MTPPESPLPLSPEADTPAEAIGPKTDGADTPAANTVPQVHGAETPAENTGPQEHAACVDGDAVKKPSLAFLLDQQPVKNELEQSFPRSVGTPPCKPPRTGQPTAYVAVVALFVALLVGVLVFMIVKHYADLNKPRVPLLHMPMHVIEGQRVIPTNTWR